MGKPKNPNKTDLLDELESIKGLLEEEIPVLEDAIPVLEDAVTLDSALNIQTYDSEPFAPGTPIPTLDDISDIPAQPHDPKSKIPLLSEISLKEPEENLVETNPEADREPPSPVDIQEALSKDPSVLPGQQSLFDLASHSKKEAKHAEGIASPSTNNEVSNKASSQTLNKPASNKPEPPKLESHTPTSPPASPQTSPQASENTDDNADGAGSVRKMAEEMLHHPLGENPFLPQHIRDRLSSTHKALEKSQSEQISTPPSTQRTSSTQQNQANQSSTHQKLVDELVAEYLPKIESELRQRLSETLAKTAPSKSSSD